jgi:hypothetical protein
MTTDNRVPARAPLYVRALRLRHLHLDGLASFLLFECMIATAVLLGLAELVSWWAVLVLPGVVAAMVKVNDLVVAGSRGRSRRRTGVAGGNSDSDAAPVNRRTIAALGRDELERARRTAERRAAAQCAESASRAERAGSPERAGSRDQAGSPERAGSLERTGSLERGRSTRPAESVDRANLPDRVGPPRQATSARQPAQPDRGGEAPERPRVGVIRISVPPRDGGMGSGASNGPGRGAGLGRSDGSGRHARGQHPDIDGHHAEGDPNLPSGRHADRVRRSADEEAARQRGTLNQGRFA